MDYTATRPRIMDHAIKLEATEIGMSVKPLRKHETRLMCWLLGCTSINHISMKSQAPSLKLLADLSYHFIEWQLHTVISWSDVGVGKCCWYLSTMAKLGQFSWSILMLKEASCKLPTTHPLWLKDFIFSATSGL